MSFSKTLFSYIITSTIGKKFDLNLYIYIYIFVFFTPPERPQVSKALLLLIPFRSRSFLRNLQPKPLPRRISPANTKGSHESFEAGGVPVTTTTELVRSDDLCHPKPSPVLAALLTPPEMETAWCLLGRMVHRRFRRSPLVG